MNLSAFVNICYRKFTSSSALRFPLTHNFVADTACDNQFDYHLTLPPLNRSKFSVLNWLIEWKIFLGIKYWNVNSIRLLHNKCLAFLNKKKMGVALAWVVRMFRRLFIRVIKANNSDSPISHASVSCSSASF